MSFLFENIEILFVLGIAIAAWLKNRADENESEEAERRAREEMARHLEKVGKRPIQKAKPEAWDTSPTQAAPATAPTPQPPPIEPAKERNSTTWDVQKPSPWEPQFEIGDPETSGGHAMESPMLQKQREMQERLAEIKRETVDFKGKKAAGARETQRRLERKGRQEEGLVPLGSLRDALQDRRQAKRAIVLREIFGKPLGLRPSTER